MDLKEIKKLQQTYSKNDLEEMLRPDEDLDPHERLQQMIMNKKMRRSGLHYLKKNMQEQMVHNNLKLAKSHEQRKSNVELVIESVANEKLRKMKNKKVHVTSMEYTECLSLLNKYLFEHSAINSVEQINEYEKIDNRNVRSLAAKIAFYEKYGGEEEELEL